jgi:hypothetical protein
VLDLHCAVEHRAVVDPDGVGVLVLAVRWTKAPMSFSALSYRSSVVIRLATASVSRGGDRVHVGEAVGHRDRQLLAGWALGDAGSDLVGERELAAEVVRAFGVDPEVGADGGDSIVLGSPVRAAQQSRNWSCWSTRLSCSRWLACAWMRRISSALGSWSSSITIRLTIGFRPSYPSLPASSWLAFAAR